MSQALDDQVLAEHAFLIVQVMRTGLTPGPEFNAAADTLDANTNDLVAAIGSVYGEAAATAPSPLPPWPPRAPR